MMRPLLINGRVNTNENVAVSGALSATDSNNNILVCSLASNCTKGTAVITNASTGAYHYTPNANATGSDSFTFRVNDGQLNSNIATVTVNITLVNVAPLASNATLNTNEDTIANGSLAATDGDTDPLIYSIVNIASQGVVTLINSSTGAYTYTPNANVTGTDNFTFKVNDGMVDSNIASVSVSIAAVNDVPVATSISFSIFNNEPVTGTLDAVDVDVDGDKLTFSLVSNPSQGTLVRSNNNTDIYTYTPNPGRQDQIVLPTASVMVRRTPILQQ